jgi:hypothetical protein
MTSKAQRDSPAQRFFNILAPMRNDRELLAQVD